MYIFVFEYLKNSCFFVYWIKERKTNIQRNGDHLFKSRNVKQTMSCFCFVITSLHILRFIPYLIQLVEYFVLFFVNILFIFLFAGELERKKNIELFELNYGNSTWLLSLYHSNDSLENRNKKRQKETPICFINSVSVSVMWYFILANYFTVPIRFIHI